MTSFISSQEEDRESADRCSAEGPIADRAPNDLRMDGGANLALTSANVTKDQLLVGFRKELQVSRTDPEVP